MSIMQHGVPNLHLQSEGALEQDDVRNMSRLSSGDQKSLGNYIHCGLVHCEADLAGGGEQPPHR